ncbi:MAG: T9SS type A sorting domain-containing protein [Bacteroidota bacterium]
MKKYNLLLTCWCMLFYFNASAQPNEQDISEMLRRSLSVNVTSFLHKKNCDPNQISPLYYDMIDKLQQMDARNVIGGSMWGIQGKKIAGENFFDHLQCFRSDLINGHPNPKKVLLEAGIYEIVSKDIVDPSHIEDPDYPIETPNSDNYNIRIPEYVWEAYNTTPYGSGDRYFDWRRMVYRSAYYLSHCGLVWDKEACEGGNLGGAYGFAPDIKLIETRMYFYFLATKYIDLGYRSIHWGQYWMYQNSQTPNRAEHFYELFEKLRTYVAQNDQFGQPWVLMNADTEGECYNGLLIFDFHNRPSRISEVWQERMDGELHTLVLPDHPSANYGRSLAGTTAYGNDYPDGTPYRIGPDSDSLKDEMACETFTKGIGNKETWGLTEQRWLLQRDRQFRKDWLIHAYCRTNSIDRHAWFKFRAKVTTSYCPGGGTLEHNVFDNGEWEDIKEIWDSHDMSNNCCPTPYVNNHPVLNYQDNVKTKKVVSGDFDGDGSRNDMATFYDFVFDGISYGLADVWISDEQDEGGKFDYRPGWWSKKSYKTSRIAGRMVAGDFNGDGIDEVAAFYLKNDGGTRIHVWLPDGHPEIKVNFCRETWWNASWYTPAKITNRVVAGDFDNDGVDEIAALHFDEDGTDVHLWDTDVLLGQGGNNLEFKYKGSQWHDPNYPAPKVNGRVVAGDFDMDGYDDIAGLYDASLNPEYVFTELHYWTPSRYQANTFHLIDDLWREQWYHASKITDRVVAGDTDGDTRNEVLGFYEHMEEYARLHRWSLDGLDLEEYYYGSVPPCGGSCVNFKSNYWEQPFGAYDPGKITGQVVSVKVNNDNNVDIAALYETGLGSSQIHTWRMVSRFQGTVLWGSDWWDSNCPWIGHNTLHFNQAACYDNLNGGGGGPAAKMVPDQEEELELEDKIELALMPNPARTSINLVINTSNAIASDLKIVNVLGEVVQSVPVALAQGQNEQSINIDISSLSSGVYTCLLKSGDTIVSQPFIKL